MLVPWGVVTLTATLPAMWSGVVTVRLVGVVAVILPAVPPNVTCVAPSRLVPVMTTLVPPAVVPLAGDTASAAGGRERVKTLMLGSVDVPAPV